MSSSQVTTVQKTDASHGACSECVGTLQGGALGRFFVSFSCTVSHENEAKTSTKRRFQMSSLIEFPCYLWARASGTFKRSALHENETKKSFMAISLMSQPILTTRHVTQWFLKIWSILLCSVYVLYTAYTRLFFIFWIRSNIFRNFSGCRHPIFKCFNIIRFVFPLAFQRCIPNCSTTKTREATAKRKRKI